MLAVRKRLDGANPPEPDTQPSRHRSVAVAADRHVVIRSLAEQLVSEANAILRERGDGINLVDDTGVAELAFTLRYRNRVARVRTVLSGRTASMQLVKTGTPVDQPRELTSDDGLAALVLSLLSD